MKQIKIIMGFLSILFGCAKTNSKKEETKLNEILVKYDDKDGYKDVNLDNPGYSRFKVFSLLSC